VTPEGSTLLVRILSAECEGVTQTVVALHDDEFALPTRCPPWSIKELLGHLWRDIDRLRTCLESPPDEPVERDAVTYWRSYDPVADGPAISDRAKEIADAYASGPDLARSFAEMWPPRLEAVEAADPSRSVQTFGPVLRLDEFMRTRVLETAVHRLDLLHALGEERTVAPASAGVIVPVLIALLGSPFPEALGWSDLEIVEAGTGRRQIGLREAEVLGELAEQFPLLA
jgi:uncharacterized protein (TIGR03083 family)